METSAAFRSLRFNLGYVGNVSNAWPSLQKTSLFACPRSLVQTDTVGKLATSAKWAGLVSSCAKTPEATVSSKSDDKIPEVSTEKHGRRMGTFPSALEGLVLEVCDETSVAELQLKIGDFEMHLKRNIEGSNAPIVMAPPVPSEPMAQSTAASAATSSRKPSAETVNLLSDVSSSVSSKLASLEASGTSGFKLVISPTVGSFRKGRTVKGKKQPPNCKQGDVIKEGQVIGYIDQFGTELPVKSDVAGEILKLLFEEGEAVGYGDPLVAVLPSFHGLNL